MAVPRERLDDLLKDIQLLPQQDNLKTKLLPTLNDPRIAFAN